MKGVLLAVEGIDGAGKSTLARGLCTRLAAGGQRVLLTAEPTDLSTGDVLRSRLAAGAKASAAEAAIDANYFIADRINHNLQRLKPALAGGFVVVCDRYDLGTLAYQSTQGLPLRYLVEMSRLIRSLHLVEAPTLTFLLDVSPETAHRRILARGRAPDKFEQRDFLASLRERYLELPKVIDDAIVVIDAEKPEQDVLEQVVEQALSLVTAANLQGEHERLC